MSKRIPYAWVVAGTTFLVLVAAAGLRSASTLYITPFEDEFGWSASTISGALALQIALFGLTGPFAAAAMVRFGVRRTVAYALILIAVASVAVTQVRVPWELWLWGAASGLGVGCIAMTLGATIANRWFESSRGLVNGLFAAGNATGQLVFLPLFAHIVVTSGWRICTLILAGVALVLIPIFVIFVRERPRDMNLPRYGATTVDPQPDTSGNPLATAFAALRDASRTRVFWLLAGSFFICGASTNGLIGAHLVPACGDHGIPETRAAGLLAAMGVFDLIGTTFSGWLSDRYDSRILLFVYYGMRGVALLFLPLAFGYGIFGLPIFAVIFGLDWIATVPPTLKIASAAFGRDRAPLVFGWITAAHQLGAGLTALAAGMVRTELGSYNDAFVWSGILCIGAALLVLTIARTPRRELAFA